MDEILKENLENDRKVIPEGGMITELPQRENLLCVISKAVFGEYSVHRIQTDSAWNANPYGEAYAIVPDEMVPDIMATKGFCDIVLNEDETEVVSFTAREIPEISEPEPEPTTDDIINALLGV